MANSPISNAYNEHDPDYATFEQLIGLIDNTDHPWLEGVSCLATRPHSFEVFDTVPSYRQHLSKSVERK